MTDLVCRGFNANRMPVVCKRKSRRPWRASIKGTPVTVHGRGERIQVSMLSWPVIHFDLPQARDEEKLRFALHYPSPRGYRFHPVEQVADDFHTHLQITSRPMNLRGLWSSKNPLLVATYATPLSISLGCWKKMQAAVQSWRNPAFSPVSQLHRNQCGRQGSYDYKGLGRGCRTSSPCLYLFGQWLSRQTNPQYGGNFVEDWKWSDTDQTWDRSNFRKKKDRNLAGPTAAPNGLYLKESRYE